jgi:hypothetical protein
MRLNLSKGPNRVGVFRPSPEDGNTCSFRYTVSSSYLEFPTMDKAHKPTDSEERGSVNTKSPQMN